MPLLHRKPFVPRKPPPDLKIDEQIFFCRLTNEVFRDYDEFFERTMLCNSLVWSCSLTGRSGLTYQEAVDSEDRARKVLETFPQPLQVPVLYLAALTRRPRMADVCDDVYAFLKDRMLVGETVEVQRGASRVSCTVLRVIPPASPPKPSPSATNGDSDVIVINGEDSGEEEAASSPLSPGGHKFGPNPDLFQYWVQPLESTNKEPFMAKADHICRKKGLFTRDKNKLFLKMHCVPGNGFWVVKPEDLAKANLRTLNFSRYWPGPLPQFSSSPIKTKEPKKRSFSSEGESASSSQDSPKKKKKPEGTSAEKKKKEKKKDKKQKEVKPVMEKPPKLSKEEREQIQAEIKKKRDEQKAAMKEELKKKKEEEKEIKRKQKEAERVARMEAMRKQMEEMKEQRRIQKEQERQEKQRRADVLREWLKPRDDMQCDDLKDLPVPTPVKTKLPTELFGDTAMVLEFLSVFKDLLGTEEEFTDGLSLEWLEDSILETRPDGGLADVLRFLLSCIFQFQDAEDEEAADEGKKEHEGATTASTTEGVDEDEDPTLSALSAAATLAAAWPVLHQGTSLRELPLEGTSLSEVLRLHLLSSGSRPSSNRAKFWYQQRGGYTPTDDPGIEFRMNEPKILKTLANGNVFDLEPVQKLKILSTLCNQLLVYVTARDFIDDRYEEMRGAQKEVKASQLAERQWEREVAADRFRRRQEERMKQREKMLKLQQEREERLRREENMPVNGEDKNGVNKTDLNTSGDSNKENLEKKGEDKKVDDDTGEVMEVDKSLSAEEEEEKKRKQEEEEERKEEERQKKEEFQQKEHDLLKKVAEATARYSIAPLGRDRSYRRYWVFHSLGGLFVEDCDDSVPPELLVPTEQKSNSSTTTAAGHQHSMPNLATALPQNNQKLMQGQSAPTEQGQTESDPQNVQPMDTTPAVVDLTADSEVQQTAAPTSDSVENMAVEEGEHEAADVEKASGVGKIHWAFYSTSEELEGLLQGLNTRGYREGALREILSQEKSRIQEAMQQCSVEDLTFVAEPEPAEVSVQPSRAAKQKAVAVAVADSSAAQALELALRDQILTMEDQIWQGTLGAIKVTDRPAWRDAIEQGSYDCQCEKLTWGSEARPFHLEAGNLCISMAENNKPEVNGKEVNEPPTLLPYRIAELKHSETPTGSTQSSTPDHPVTTVVRELAAAVLQLEQCVERRFLKEPLGEDETTKKALGKIDKKNRRKDDDNESVGTNESEDTDPGKVQKTVLERWEESLMSATSLPQVFLHLATLDRSIMWAKSVLNARCRMCRRKGDAEKMLLCDGCDRGHHMYCLKPPLKKVPEGDWYCHTCKPQMQKRAMPQTPRRRRTMDSDSESSDSEEESDEEAEDDSDSEEEESEEEEELEESDEEESEEESEEEEEEEEKAAVTAEIEHADICSICSDGGVLVLCDTCPCAFHLLCADPPLNRIPRGKWRCQYCTGRVLREPGRTRRDNKDEKKGKSGQKPAAKSQGKAASSQEGSRPSSRAESSSSRSRAEPSNNSRSNSRANSLDRTTSRNTRRNILPDPVPSSKPRSTSLQRGAGTSQKRGLVDTDEDSDVSGSNKRTRRQKVLQSSDDSQDEKVQVTSKRPRKAVIESSEESSASDVKSAKTKAKEVKKPERTSTSQIKVISATKDNRRRSQDPGSSSKRPSSPRVPDTRRDSGPSRRLSSGLRGGEEVGWTTKCEILLTELVKHQDAWPFIKPVSRKEAPDYYKLVRKPMDLSTLRTNFNQMAYRTAAELLADARLVFSNCEQYNQPHATEARCGRRLELYFETRVKELKLEAPQQKKLI
ncbi:bromodomain adjacent to zinc finger domain protein 1A-like [Branchiostoma floridae]|uniref:Bromodomain adjacent to zinc finger domain protein 1A n=1 Tax=Branchiostoma floridae TaxID=7739 RepID=A0A9J7L801_BRAFL|nr:bromodomain adjacent to zinc finger domain protein 1A-like [Branchiostoma floridae]